MDTISQQDCTWGQLSAVQHLVTFAIVHPVPVQVRKVAEENGVDVTEQIRELEDRAQQVVEIIWRWA